MNLSEKKAVRMHKLQFKLVEPKDRTTRHNGVAKVARFISKWRAA